MMKLFEKKFMTHIWRVWKRNLFQVPKESIDKSFINELTSAIDLWNNNLPYRDVSLKMFMLLPNLLLQCTCHKSKTIDNKDILDRRLALWRSKKGLVIQIQLTLHKKWSFPIRISTVNVTKSAVNRGFGHIYWEILNGKFHFLCSV